jgi:hypothetical protein
VKKEKDDVWRRRERTRRAAGRRDLRERGEARRELTLPAPVHFTTTFPTF